MVLKCLVLIFHILGYSQSEDLQETFSQANKFYQQSNFNQAITNYELILNNGIKDSKVYYNLGNAYYRINQIGKSILYYERALKISPRDEDIRYNLNFVRSFVKEPDENILYKTISLLSLDEISILCSIVYFLLITGVIGYMFFHNSIIKWINITLGIIFALNLLLWYNKFIIEEKTVSGIVITTPAQARTAPGEDEAVGFTLPAGKKVTILTEKEDWYAIAVKQLESVDDEVKSIILKGWIPKQVIEKIGNEQQ